MRKLKMHSITKLVLYAVKNRISWSPMSLNKPRKPQPGWGVSVK
jgi:hypothetical protein